MKTQDAPQKLADSAASHLQVPARYRFLRSLVLSILLAFLLETGTLIGAPVASPLVLSDWRPKRMLVFFVLSLLFVLWLTSSTMCHARSKWLNSLRGIEPMRARRITCNLLILCAATVLGWLVCHLIATILSLPWDFRYGMIASFLAFSITSLVVLRDVLSTKPEWGFLAISLAFGTLLSALMPAYSAISFDGFIHYDNSLAISYVCDAEYSGADAVMSSENAAAWALFANSQSESQYTLADLSPSTISSINQFLLDSDEGKDVVVREGTACLNSSTYISSSMIGHLPNAAGLWLGRLLHLSCLGQFFLGRLLSIYFYCFVFFLAIKHLKSGKLILIAVALIPSVLLLAANYSYDPWCICLIAYSFARFIGCIQSGKSLTKEDGLSIGISFMLGSLVKAIYFPLAFVFLLVPDKLVGDHTAVRRYRLGVLTVIVLLLASFAIPFLTAGPGTGDTRGGETVNASQQVLYILQEPLSYMQVFICFLSQFFSLDTTEGFLGYLNYSPFLFDRAITVGAPGLSALELMLIGSTSLIDRRSADQGYSGWRWKVVTLLSVGISFGLVATALYVSFTPLRYFTILGVQSRYFFPFLSPLCLVCLNTSVANNMNQKKLNATLLGIELVLLFATIAIDFAAFF